MSDFKFAFHVSEGDYIRLQRAFEQLSQIEKDVLIKKGFKQGSDLLLIAGKASLNEKNKKKSGNLYRSFTNSFKKKKTGVLVGFKRGKGKGNHAHLIDRGTTHRFTQKAYVDKLGRRYPAELYRGKIDSAGVGSRGRQKTGKTYFWTSVVQSKGNEAMNKITNAIFRAIDAIKNRN